MELGRELRKAQKFLIIQVGSQVDRFPASLGLGTLTSWQVAEQVWVYRVLFLLALPIFYTCVVLLCNSSSKRASGWLIDRFSFQFNQEKHPLYENDELMKKQKLLIKYENLENNVDIGQKQKVLTHRSFKTWKKD